MKAIILAAGRGTRLKPLSNTTPKPMIPIMGKPILEYNLEAIYQEVNEIIIIIKYLGEQIQQYFGDNYKTIPIHYHIQGDDKGTAGALKGINSNDDVFIIYGDQIIEPSDYNKVLKYKGYGALAKHVVSPEKYGIYQIDQKGFALELIEKPQNPIGNLANIGGFKLPCDIFKILKTLPLSARNEYELPDIINTIIKKYPFRIFEAQGDFIDIGYPWDVLKANSILLNALTTSKIEGTIEDRVTIKGNIILEKGAILKSGTYIEGNVYIGKNCNIGPNCYIRGESVIGDNCHIGNAVEIKNCSFGNNSNAGHLTYLGDSVVGNNVNLGAGFISANLRNDGENMRCLINNELISTGRRKLGVIIGDNSKIGIQSISYPARVVESNSFLFPATIIK